MDSTYLWYIYSSGIEGDLPMSYYSKAKKWSNIYVIEIMLGDRNGNDFKKPSKENILSWCLHY